MTDILTLIENLAPLALLIAIPIVAVRLLDGPGVHVPESGPARTPAVPEPEPPRWRLDRLPRRMDGAVGDPGSHVLRSRSPHPTGCVPA